jgi:hypothetical protein
VTEAVEQGEPLSPCDAGRLEIARGAMGVAEMGEGDGFLAPVAELPEQVECVLVAGDGLGVVAKVLVGEAEAVPRQGLPWAVAELLVPAQGFLAEGEGALVVA